MSQMWKSSGGSAEWFTPPWVFEALDVEFDLDVCSPGHRKCFVPARRVYTAEHDGLSKSWGKGLVWCNPPYGRGISDWMDKLAKHHNGLGFVLARTDAKWFQKAAVEADALCFLSRRPMFYMGSKETPATNNSGAGSVLFAYGTKATSVVEKSGLGIVLRKA